MKLINKIIVLLSLYVSTTQGVAFAGEINGECYKCSYSQREAVAITLAQQHLDQGESLFRVHIFDLPNMIISSFKIVDMDGTFVTTSITTPADIEQYMMDVKESFQNLRTMANNIVIPTTVIDNAWRYANCAFCENNITDYIRGTLDGQITAATLTIAAIAQAVDLVQTNMPNQYSFALANGGEVIVELGISAEATLTMKIVKMIDKNNNTIPAIASSLRQLQIQISTEAEVALINSFINNFNFYVPKGTIGIVTITDCPAEGCNINEP
jgi:hypothetical protein